MKQWFSLLLALVMVAVCIPAAMGENDPLAPYPETIVITSSKDLGANSPTYPEGDSLENNVWTRLYKDALNIDVQFVLATNEQQYAQKANIAITSNDIPEVMKVSSAQLSLMHENDQLMDMTDILEANMSDLVRKTIYSDGGLSLNSATFGGKLYAIPNIGSSLLSAYVLWVRTDWLDKLGLKAPTTMDELLEVARAFVEKDPNGTGANDTYGLAIYKDIFDGGFSCMEGFFNAFGAYPNIWIKKDDKLAYGSVQPEVKEALQTLQTMYKEHLLDPEFGVKDAGKVSEDISAGKIGMFFGAFWNAAMINDAKVANPEMEWQPIAIPSATGSLAKAQIPFGTSSYYAVSKNCKNPEAIVKLLNLQMEKNYGENAEPTVYNVTPDGYGTYAYTVIALEPTMKNFEAAKKVTAALETGDTSAMNDEEKGYYDMCVLCRDGDYTNSNWHQMKMFGPNGSLSVIQEYYDANNIVVDEFFGAATQTMSEKLSTLQKQQLTDFTAIIMGADINTFDTFVSNWNKLGGEKMTEEVNEWYASMQ